MLRVIAVAGLYGFGTLLTFRGIEFAACLFIWNDIFRPLDFARRMLDFPSTHYVIALLGLQLFLRPWVRRWNPAATVITVMLVWMAVCTFKAYHASVAQPAFERYLKYMIPLGIISISLVTRFGQNMFVWTLAACVGIWGAQAGFYCISRGAPAPNMAIPGGQMSDRNDFVVGIVAAIPLVAYTGWHYAWFFAKWGRLIARFALFGCIAAVLFSLSRGGIVGISTLALYFMLATGRIGKRALYGVAAGALVFAFLPGFVTERMSTIEMNTQYQSEGSAASRLNLVKTGVDMALSNPITGVGPANFPYLAQSYGHWAPHEPHNIWLKAAGEFGFPMLTLFVLTILLMLRNLGKERRLARLEGDRETEHLATALACAIVGFCATATFTSVFVSEYLWAIIAVSGAFIARQRHVRKHPTITPESETTETERETAVPA